MALFNPTRFLRRSGFAAGLAVATAAASAFAQTDPFQSNPAPAPVAPPKPHIVRPAPEPEPATPQPAAAPTPAPSRFDEQRVRLLAAKLAIPLPLTSSIVPSSPAPGVPVSAAAYLGAWDGQRRWNGKGRQIMVIVTSVDPAGNATGFYAQGAPNSQTYDQSGSSWHAFQGKIDAGGLKFTQGRYLNYGFAVSAADPSSMLGQVIGDDPGKPLQASIALDRVQ